MLSEHQRHRGHGFWGCRQEAAGDQLCMQAAKIGGAPARPAPSPARTPPRSCCTASPRTSRSRSCAPARGPGDLKESQKNRINPRTQVALNTSPECSAVRQDPATLRRPAISVPPGATPSRYGWPALEESQEQAPGLRARVRGAEGLHLADGNGEEVGVDARIEVQDLQHLLGSLSLHATANIGSSPLS